MADSFLTELTARLWILWIKFRKLFHRHRYDIPGAEEIKVGLTGGRHTEFLIFKCKCGNKLAFPESNFNIAQHEGTEQTIKFIASLGV